VARLKYLIIFLCLFSNIEFSEQLGCDELPLNQLIFKFFPKLLRGEAQLTAAMTRSMKPLRGRALNPLLN
jgi:hypothetical protein